MEGFVGLAGYGMGVVCTYMSWGGRLGASSFIPSDASSSSSARRGSKL